MHTTSGRQLLHTHLRTKVRQLNRLSAPRCVGSSPALSIRRSARRPCPRSSAAVIALPIGVIVCDREATSAFRLLLLLSRNGPCRAARDAFHGIHGLGPSQRTSVQRSRTGSDTSSKRFALLQLHHVKPS